MTHTSHYNYNSGPLYAYTEVEDRGIATVHPQLKERLAQIYRCRDAIRGTDAIKGAGDLYLPRLGDQAEDEYEAYKTRANFLGATERTVSVMVGSLLRKPAEVNLPDKLDYLVEDITGHGESLEDFIRQVSHCLMGTGRVAILLDRITGTEPNNKIYYKYFPSDQITDWDVDESPGKPRKLTRVVLEEYFLVRDGFRKELRVRYREYELKNNICTVTFHKQLGDQNVGMKLSQSNLRAIQFKKGRKIILKSRGKPLDYIPVTFVSSGQEDNYEPGKPPVLDVADINLSHYRTSADLEHGRHWTALPTPYFTGLATDSEIVIGSGKAMIMTDPSSKAGFLEFSGSGLKSLEAARKEKEDQMAFLGARMLTDKSNGSENAEVTRINHSGEIAVLTDLARALSRSLTKAFKYSAKWDNLPEDDIVVSINTDYINTYMSSSDLQSLTSAYQAGAISLDTYLARLQRGEIIPEDVDIEDEKEKIEQQKADAALAELGVPGEGGADDEFNLGETE
jgi:hypothetical protein